MSSQARVAKEKMNKWDYIKLKMFWKSEEQNEKKTYLMEDNIHK